MDAQTFFTDILPIPDEALRAQIVSLAQFRHLSKGELLVREGETINQLSFLLSGILRGFFFDYNGRYYRLLWCQVRGAGDSRLSAGRPFPHLH